MALTEEEFEILVNKYAAGEATQKELDQLEPYRAQRAVLLASGFGSRMMPITINTPKPLVEVNGRRIIETILDALLAIGIEEIYIVTGYKKEQFQLLKADYPTINLIENPAYAATNNISSACAAREHFENAYVFESDLFLSNPSILTKYRYRSCYFAVPVAETEDWCFDTKDGYICDLHKGGQDCHHMFGISYWTAQDGKKLEQDLWDCFNEDDSIKQRFWDDVPCVLRQSNYQLTIEKCSFDDVAEIDSIKELQEIDSRYRL